MPVIGAIFGAIMTGLMYWLFWGKGLEYIDHRMRQSADERRSRKQRAAAEERRRLSGLRTVTDPRDAATILMLLVVLQRGVPTPEQVAAVEEQMRSVLELGGEVTHRLTAARFTAEQCGSFEDAVEELGPMLRAHLSKSERADLVEMLRKVGSLHGGPTSEQERAVALTERVLART